MRKELSKEEQKEANKIIEKYKKYTEELNKIEKELHRIDKRKEDIFKSIESTKAVEDKFFLSLKKKYGEGKLDLLTFEYITE